MCGVCAVFVLFWCDFGAVFVLFWCDFGAVFVLLWCDFGAVFVLFWCDFSAVFVLFWCGVCAVFHIHRTYTAQIPEKGKRRGSVSSSFFHFRFHQSLNIEGATTLSTVAGKDQTSLAVNSGIKRKSISPFLLLFSTVDFIKAPIPKLKLHPTTSGEIVFLYQTPGAFFFPVFARCMCGVCEIPHQRPTKIAQRPH